MLSATELEIQSAITQAFILADPESIIFQRRTQTADGAGGFILGAPAPLSNAQTVRLIPASDKVPEVSTSDGRRARPELVVLAPRDVDRAKYDQFTYDGRTYEIAEIHDKPDYERKGDAVVYAG